MSQGPVQARAVSFRSDQLTLAGTFVDAEAPVACALLLAGSGRTDRDSNTRWLKLGITAAIADALREVSVSSLRFDKRGVGASEGDFLKAGMSDNLVDARAALTWLKGHCPESPLFVIGHSEGGLHAAQLAAEQRVAGAVLLSIPVRTGEEVLVWQLRAIVPTLPRVVRGVMRLLRSDPERTQRKQFARIRAGSGEALRIQGRRVNARWLGEFLDYDPTPSLSEVTAPVLVITGSHDLQVPPEDTGRACRLVKGVCSRYVVDGLSHLLRADPESRGPLRYRRAVREPVDLSVLALITAWIAQTASERETGPDRVEAR